MIKQDNFKDFLGLCALQTCTFGMFWCIKKCKTSSQSIPKRASQLVFCVLELVEYDCRKWYTKILSSQTTLLLWTICFPSDLGLFWEQSAAHELTNVSTAAVRWNLTTGEEDTVQCWTQQFRCVTAGKGEASAVPYRSWSGARDNVVIAFEGGQLKDSVNIPQGVDANCSWVPVTFIIKRFYLIELHIKRLYCKWSKCLI